MTPYLIVFELYLNYKKWIPPSYHHNGSWHLLNLGPRFLVTHQGFHYGVTGVHQLGAVIDACENSKSATSRITELMEHKIGL